MSSISRGLIKRVVIVYCCTSKFLRPRLTVADHGCVVSAVSVYWNSDLGPVMCAPRYCWPPAQPAGAPSDGQNEHWNELEH